MQKLNSRVFGREDLVGEITGRSMEDEWIAGDIENKENTRRAQRRLCEQRLQGMFCTQS